VQPRQPASTDANNVMFPAKPLMLPTVTSSLADVPSLRVKEPGFVVMLNGVTIKLKEMDWVDLPLVPVTVTLYTPGCVAENVETFSEELLFGWLGTR